MPLDDYAQTVEDDVPFVINAKLNSAGRHELVLNGEEVLLTGKSLDLLTHAVQVFDNEEAHGQSMGWEKAERTQQRENYAPP